MTRRRGAPPHERACRLGAGCRCARPPPGSPLRSDPAPRGAGGDLDPVSAHRRGAITGSRPRPATQLARHDHDENRPGRLHLSKARFWSERWGPPQSRSPARLHLTRRHALGRVPDVEPLGPDVRWSRHRLFPATTVVSTRSCHSSCRRTRRWRPAGFHSHLTLTRRWAEQARSWPDRAAGMVRRGLRRVTQSIFHLATRPRPPEKDVNPGSPG